MNQNRSIIPGVRAGVTRRDFLRGLSLSALSALVPADVLGAEDPVSLAIKGQDLLALGRIDSAVEVLERAVRLDPENGWTWGLLGRAAFKAGNGSRAYECFNRALSLNPEDDYSRIMLDLIRQKSLAGRGGVEGSGSGEGELERSAREELALREKEAGKGDSGAGYRINRVVLDPGHGGFDSGAVSPGGLKEKDAALDLALKAADFMDKLSPGVKVFLTRTGDYFMPLSARTAAANQYNADLFLSIHVNASRIKIANGVETYFCSEKGSSKEAERVAAFENSVLELEEDESGAKGAVDIEDILFRFERRRYWRAGAGAAKGLQQVLAPGLDMRDRGVRSGNFFVLRKARTAAVLLEAGFLSNPEDEARLARGDERERMASVIAGAVAGLRANQAGV